MCVKIAMLFARLVLIRQSRERGKGKAIVAGKNRDRMKPALPASIPSSSFVDIPSKLLLRNYQRGGCKIA